MTAFSDVLCAHTDLLDRMISNLDSVTRTKRCGEELGEGDIVRALKGTLYLPRYMACVLVPATVFLSDT